MAQVERQYNGKNWLSYSICIAIFLAIVLAGFSPFFGAFFLKTLFSNIPIIFGCGLAFGIVAVLAIIHTLLNFPVIRLIPPIILGIVTLLFLYMLFGCFVLYLFGASFDHDFPGGAKYRAEIKGLDNCTGRGDTRLLVPVPIVDEKPVFDAKYASVEPALWKARLIDTAMGPMIELSTNETQLANLSLEYETSVLHSYDYDRRKTILNGSFPVYLYPAVKKGYINTTGSATAYSDNSVYHSLVYADGGISHMQGDEQITCEFTFAATPGQGHNHRYGPTYLISGNCTIPLENAGWISVELHSAERDGNYLFY